MSTSRTFRPAPELVAAIRAGEQEAEEELVLRFRRGVAAVLRQMLGQRVDTEDLFQDTFRLALEKIRRGEVRQPDQLAGFISSLARNLAINLLRLEKRRKTDQGLDGFADPAPEDGPLPLALQMPESQLGRLLREEKARLVRRVLVEVGTERDRQLLFRYYLAEDDKDAICADLGLSDAHFHRVLYRARQRYRALYEKAVGDG